MLSEEDEHQTVDCSLNEKVRIEHESQVRLAVLVFEREFLGEDSASPVFALLDYGDTSNAEAENREESECEED